MPGPPIFDPIGPPRTIPFWLSQGGKGSFPLSYLGVTREALTKQHRWGVPREDVDGNSLAPVADWFFKLKQSGTAGLGRTPLASLWVTRAALMKDVRWASRDYALRKVADDWFFGASSTFGMIVERVRVPVLNGWGSWPLRSRLVSRASAPRDLHYANGGTRLQEIMEDWFFGKTAGSPDMHIMYTRASYPGDKQLRVTILPGRLVEFPSRRMFSFFVTRPSLIRVHRFANSETALTTVSNRWFFGYETLPDYRQVITFE